jgi:hypothetical protein
MVAAIGTGDVFSKGRDFGAWLGLVPKQISTGDRTILGSISKRGNRYLRVLFVQAARVVLGKLKPEDWERYGLRSWIEAAKKRLHHNVLAIALANKLARIAYQIARALISMMARSTMLQSEAGYIDARPHRQDRQNLLQRTAGPYIGVKTRMASDYPYVSFHHNRTHAAAAKDVGRGRGGFHRAPPHPIIARCICGVTSIDRPLCRARP